MRRIFSFVCERQSVPRTVAPTFKSADFRFMWRPEGRRYTGCFCAVILAGLVFLALAGAYPAAAQTGTLEKDLIATGPLFIEPRPGTPATPAASTTGAGSSFPPKDTRGGESAPSKASATPPAMGVASLRVHGSGAAMRYYTLLAGRDSAGVIVFSADGTRMAQIPAAPGTVAAAIAIPAPSAKSTSPAAPVASPAASGVGAPVTRSGGASEPTTAPALAMPPAQAKDAKLIFPVDFDVDAGGRVLIADRGADAIKIYDSAGVLLSLIPVQAPVSVAALPGGEIAVTNLRSEKLVTVYGLRASPIGGASQWKVAREFGDPADITSDAEARELNRYVNIGRLAGDAEGNLYYTFFYLPEPTVRKYDRWGFLISEVALTTPEFQSSAQSARRAIERLRQARLTIGSTSSGPILRQSVNALGVDPASQDLWVALGTLILHFDADGRRKGSYRSYSPSLQRVEATSIVVEPGRLIISSDSLGAFEFPRPDKAAPK